MSNSQSEDKANKMIQALDWAYEKAINGLPGMGSATDLALQYQNGAGTLEEKVNSLIRWQISKTATSGFLTGLGGLITLPVAIPADIASAVYVQIRMIAAIAYMGGYDIRDDKVKTLVYLCLVGESAKDILKDVSVQVTLKIGQNLLEKLPSKILSKVNNAVGFRLVTKFGSKGAVNIVKILPVFGGIVGGSINAITTNAIGNYARTTFIKTKDQVPDAEQFIDFMNFKEDSPNLELLKFYSYLNIIKIDGVKSPEEYQIFENLIDNSMLSKALKMELLEKLNSNEIIEVDYSLFENYEEQSLDLLRNLILISRSDNELHFTEKMYIKDIGEQLNYTKHDIEKLISETNPS